MKPPENVYSAIIDVLQAHPDGMEPNDMFAAVLGLKPENIRSSDIPRNLKRATWELLDSSLGADVVVPIEAERLAKLHPIDFTSEQMLVLRPKSVPRVLNNHLHS